MAIGTLEQSNLSEYLEKYRTGSVLSNELLSENGYSNYQDAEKLRRRLEGIVGIRGEIDDQQDETNNQVFSDNLFGELAAVKKASEKKDLSEEEKGKLIHHINSIAQLIGDLFRHDYNGKPESFAGRDREIGILKRLLDSMRETGLSFSDVFPKSDVNLERVIELKYRLGNIESYRKFATDPYSVGVYFEGDQHMAARIVVQSKKKMFLTGEFDKIDQLKKLSELYPEIFTEIEQCAKLQAIQSFKRMLLQNGQYRLGKNSSQEPTIEIKGIGYPALVSWLQELESIGLSVKEATGAELENLFIVVDRSGKRLTKELEQEFFKLLDMATKHDFIKDSDAFDPIAVAVHEFFAKKQIESPITINFPREIVVKALVPISNKPEEAFEWPEGLELQYSSGQL